MSGASICRISLRGWIRFLPLLALGGCASSPSFNVLGSFFPSWIAAILGGILLDALLALLLKRLNLERRIAALPLFYVSVALLLACLIWLIAFE